MIRIISATVVICLVLFAGSAMAIDGVQCELNVSQLNTVTGENVLLYSDTSWFLDSLTSVGFLVSFSTEFEFTRIDTNRCEFLLHVVTLDQPVHNYSQDFQVEYGLPARIDSIVGKNNALYTLAVTPLRSSEIDTSGCSVVHTRQGDFRFDPSAYMDIYYVPNSFGDFYWNTVKGIMDERYRVFKSINNFTLPGKYAIYLCPCPIYSVIWDKRFGMMIDPTRNIAFALYNHDVNTADPFLILDASVYRNYGYAPAFVAEGLASYLTYAAFEMKQLIAESRNLPIESLLVTYNYYTADPAVADRTSATFIKYLINEYKIDKLLEVYRRADDLNLQATIEDVYQKPVSQLEKEWIQYVDTVSISFDQLLHYSDLAEAMFNYKMMLHYSRGLLQEATERPDTVLALRNLARASFSTGDYYGASGYEEQLCELQDTVVLNWLALAGYQMMNGNYDTARTNLEHAHAIDTTEQLVRFNLALNDLYRGDTAAAKKEFTSLVFESRQGGPFGESRVMLGHLLLRSGNEDDRAQAEKYFHEALSYFAQAINSGNPSPTSHIWAGMAYLGLGNTSDAYDFLHTGLYLEKRPFYIGMAQLWLGKTADIRGERDVAEEYYNYVLAGASAAYHQAEAREYLKKPYRQ